MTSFLVNRYIFPPVILSLILNLLPVQRRHFGHLILFIVSNTLFCSKVVTQIYEIFLMKKHNIQTRCIAIKTCSWLCRPAKRVFNTLLNPMCDTQRIECLEGVRILKFLCYLIGFEEFYVLNKIPYNNVLLDLYLFYCWFLKNDFRACRLCSNVSNLEIVWFLIVLH